MAGITGGTQGGRAQPAFDFTAAASQIQEFLNAFGIPIDVVELYDNYGNYGQPRAGANDQNQQQPTTAATGATAEATAAPNAAPPTPPDTSAASPAPVNTEAGNTTPATQSTLVSDLQQLNLDAANANRDGTGTQDGGATSVPVTMELDADSAGAGWTLLDHQQNYERPATAAVPGPTSEPQSVTSGPTTMEANFPSAPASAPGVETTPTTSPRTGRIYPTINPPQLQQLLSGVSQAVNSVVRNIPIVTNPGGPTSTGSGFTPVATPTSSGPQSGNMDEAMRVRCNATLNQLLAMGFSNNGGWLSRLVTAKNGDLEAVLNALYPAQ